MLNEQLVNRALGEIRKGYAQYQYFFEHLDSPEWLTPLAEHGLFRDPPPPEDVAEYVRFPFWPESRYLVRMASIEEAQPSVLRIALGIPPSKNSRIYDDIVDISLALPADSSSRLVPQVVAGIQLPIKLVLQDRIGDLIRQLAEGGQADIAVTLTRSALALSPDPRPQPAEDELGLHSPEPQSQFRDWYYARIVDKALPALVQAAGIRAVAAYADLLDDAIRLSRRRSEQPENDEDYLYIAHPAIEQGPGRDDVSNILIEAVRRSAEELISSEPAQFLAVIEILDSKKWVTFRRLKLHLCRVFPEVDTTTAEELLSNPETVNRGSLQHEAVLLLSASFGRLRPEAQAHILANIDAGRPEELSRRWLEFTQQPVTDENIQRLSDMWRRDHLAILEGQLPEAHQRMLDELIGRLGPARALGEPRMTTGGAVGAQSPKSDEEIQAMSVEDLLKFMRTWTPGTDIFQPTAEGLGKAVTARMAKDPGPFIEHAAEFQGLDPTYVRAFLAGALTALKEKTIFDWRPVLELAAWMAQQPREIPARKGELMITDPDWGWARDAAIDLLTAGFDRNLPGRFGYELREPVWGVLHPLTDDPNPSLEDEGGARFDPGHLSINSTRGRAMHAVVAYARWVRLSTDAQKAPEQPSITFKEMPEVRERLEGHLDVNREPTLTIRSVYGHHINLLAALDFDWLTAHLEFIFPREDGPRFKAAWDDFITWNAPNTSLLPQLVPCYSRALEAVNRADKRQTRSAADCLAEHLMVFYWLGRIGFDSADGLLAAFYGTAPAEVRGHAIWFVGTRVPAWTDAPPEAFARLQDLFVRRLSAAMAAPSPEPFKRELKGFGYWFTSKRFDEQWSLETLLATLRLTKKADPEMDLVKRLAELSPSYPVECVTALRLMIEGDIEGWLIIGIEENARLVLRGALESNNPEGALAARRVVEELIARGQFGFQSLLN